MWVETGQTYNISGLEFNGDIFFSFSDIELSTAEGTDPNDEWVDLNLMVHGKTNSCRLTAAHDRKWLANKGIGQDYHRSACTEAFAEMSPYSKFSLLFC